MRLVNLVKGNKVEETLAEINRKMQRALEEALMKNIHLHKVSVCGESIVTEHLSSQESLFADL